MCTALSMEQSLSKEFGNGAGIGLTLSLFWHEGETYYIAYKSSDGRLHIVNAKTAHTYMDLCVVSAKPKFTHVVYVALNGGHFAAFLNAATNEFEVLKIDIGELKSTVSRVHIVKFESSFTFSHLLSFNHTLMGYSTATGDVALYQIGKSWEIKPPVYVSVTKDLTSLYPVRSQSDQFFGYSPVSGKIFVYNVTNANVTIQRMICGCALALDFVIPLKIGTLDYLVSYQNSTQTLKFMKSANFTYTPYATHTLPFPLTSLTFMERRLH